MNFSGFVAGIIFEFLGIFLFVSSIHTRNEMDRILLILLSILILGIGVYILMNSEKEDKIEGIKKSIK